MTFDDDQISLINAAEEFVTYSLNDGGSFLLFGLVMQESGEINPAQPSSEFKDDNEALRGIKSHFCARAHADEIRACLVCQPIAAVHEIVSVFIQVESAISGPSAFTSRVKLDSNGAYHLYGRDRAPAEAFAFSA